MLFDLISVYCFCSTINWMLLLIFISDHKNSLFLLANKHKGLMFFPRLVLSGSIPMGYRL